MNHLTRPVVVLIVAAGAALPQVGAADLAEVSDVATTFAQRVGVSLQAYKDQSTGISDEKVPLVREINRLEDENIQLREQIGQAQKLTVDNNSSFDALRNRLEGLKAQTEFAQRFLQEYLDGFESRTHTAEDQKYKGDLTKIRLALEPANPDMSQRFATQIEAIEIGLQRAEHVIGGYTFEGAGITPEGVLKTGVIHVFGPTAIFSDVKSGGTTSGMLTFHSGTIEPAIIRLAGSHNDAIARLTRDGAGPVPLDASLGDAVALDSTNVRVADHIRNGGPVGIAIILLGAVAAILSAVKILDLRRFRSMPPELLQQIIRETRARNEPAALALVRRISGPTAEMLELGVRNARANLVLLEELMLSVILRRRPEAERFLPFLAITVVASPLLGLLGTVVGMIRTFALITVLGTGDPRALSSGISEALITTEFGLMVAIPVLVVHSMFRRMIKSRSGDMEHVAFEFVKGLSLAETTPPPAPTATPASVS